MTKRSARAVVIKDAQLLVMYRNKFGSKYVTLPGGSLELGERLEECAIREVFEETMIEVKSPRLVFIDHAEFYGDQYVYLCEYVSGQPQLSEGTHEFEINKLGKNLYEPGWLPLSQLSSIDFVSPELQAAIKAAYSDGWPEVPVEFPSKRTVK